MGVGGAVPSRSRGRGERRRPGWAPTGESAGGEGWSTPGALTGGTGKERRRVPRLWSTQQRREVKRGPSSPQKVLNFVSDHSSNSGLAVSVATCCCPGIRRMAPGGMKRSLWPQRPMEPKGQQGPFWNPIRPTRTLCSCDDSYTQAHPRRRRSAPGSGRVRRRCFTLWAGRGTPGGPELPPLPANSTPPTTSFTYIRTTFTVTMGPRPYR